MAEIEIVFLENHVLPNGAGIFLAGMDHPFDKKIADDLVARGIAKVKPKTKADEKADDKKESHAKE